MQYHSPNLATSDEACSAASPAPAIAGVRRQPGGRPGQAARGHEVISLSVVSNSRLMREGLVTLLATHIPVRLAGAYSGEPDTELQLPNPPDHVVLLDSGVGQEAARAWTRLWTGLAPSARVIVLELLNDADLIVSCIEAGAGGYTLRGASVAEVADAILQVRSGAARCSPEVAARLFARVASLSAARPRFPAGPSPLTPRELEVLRCIAADYSNQEIAERLVLQVATVKHHVHNILDKLHLRHRWDAARLAIERGWLDEEWQGFANKSISA